MNLKLADLEECELAAAVREKLEAQASIFSLSQFFFFFFFLSGKTYEDQIQRSKNRIARNLRLDSGGPGMKEV